MGRYIYKFKVDEQTGISPTFHKNKLLKLFKKNNPLHSLEIIGNTNSLVLINEVADYFYWETAKELEWTYTASDSINPDTILALINTL